MVIQFYFGLAFIVCSAIFGLLSLKKLSRPFIVLVFLICVVFAMEMLGRIPAFFGMNGSHFIYHFSTPIYISINLILFLKIFEFSSNAKKRNTIILSILMLIGTIVNSFFYQSIDQFSSIGISLHSFQTIMLSLFVFQDMLKQPISIPILRQPIFWLVSGNLIFYTINFLVFAFLNFYIDMKNVSDWLMQINWIGNLILYSSYFRALYLDRNRLHAD